MRFDELNENNYMLFAIKFYDNPHALTKEEFEDDLKRIKYVKRLLKRYKNTGVLKTHLILNHLTVLFNVTNIGSNIYNNEIGGSSPLSILYPSGTLPNDLIDENFQYGSNGRNKFMGIETGPFSATFTVVEN